MDDAQTPRITRLGTDECWSLLQQTGVGALATAADGRADVFPINYLVDGRTLLFRSAPGAKITALEIAPDAAFVTQGHDADGNWSVVIRGLVETLGDQVDIIGSGALELTSWAEGPKPVFLRLTPATVNGRRVLRADLERSNLYG